MRSRSLIVFGLLLVTAAAAPTAAGAGTYDVYACHTPNGGFASTEGWSFGGSVMTSWNAVNDCQVNGANHPGGSMTTAVAGLAQYSSEQGTHVVFTAPPGVTVDWIRVGMCAAADYDAAFSIGPVAGRSWYPEPDPRVTLVYPGDWSTTGQPTTRGCSGGEPYWRPDIAPDGRSNYFERSGLGASQVWFTAWCWEYCRPPLIPPYSEPRCTVRVCVNTNAIAGVSIASARLTLRDDHAPTVSRVTGTLASATTARGRLAARFDAADVGAGVYRAIVDVQLNQSGEWRTFVDDVVNPHRGRCAPAGVTGRVHEFVYPTPCPPSVQDGTVAFDTAVLPPGDHLVRVQLEDAAGNRVDAVPARILHVSAPRESTPFGGGSVSPPAPLGPEALPANNGRRASASALLRAYRGRVVRFGAAAAVGGRLVDEHERPIANARLQVDWRRLAPRHGPIGRDWKPLGTVRTDRRGRFVARIPAGGSRLLRFSYRANLDQPGFTSTAESAVRVRARVRAQATRSTVRNGRTAIFRGRITGPVPRGGVEVTLQAWVQGRGWTPARTEERDPRAGAGGRFVVSYRFARTYERMRYRFRVVSGEDSSYAFARSGSRPVDVVVIP